MSDCEKIKEKKKITPFHWQYDYNQNFGRGQRDCGYDEKFEKYRPVKLTINALVDIPVNMTMDIPKLLMKQKDFVEYKENERKSERSEAFCQYKASEEPMKYECENFKVKKIHIKRNQRESTKD